MGILFTLIMACIAVIGVITVISWIVCVSDNTSVESVGKVKSKNGIIFNPIKHLYYVHQEDYPTLRVNLMELFAFEPGYFISQFHRNVSFDEFLKNKYGETNED